MKKFFLTTMFIGVTAVTSIAKAEIPSDFADLASLDKSILMDIRYATSHNFIGDKVDGYLAPKCILTKRAADGLVRAQKAFLKLGFTLKMYDCYRPQRAVNHFVRWANDLSDVRMKNEFYPNLAKSDLIPEYIASKSGHSRGSTFDLTLVALPPKPQEVFDPGNLRDCRAPFDSRFGDNSIDMGTGYDCFDPLAHTDNPAMSAAILKNRHVLVDTLAQFGFSNYAAEWWHFTLKNEPYPNTFFDFPIN